MEKIRYTRLRHSRGFKYFVKSALLCALGIILFIIGFVAAGFFIIF